MKHFISSVEMIVESQESGWFYPKVLTGRPGFITSQDPQGWNFCRGGENCAIIRFRTFAEAEQHLLDRTELTLKEIVQEKKKVY